MKRVFFILGFGVSLTVSVSLFIASASGPRVKHRTTHNSSRAGAKGVVQRPLLAAGQSATLLPDGNWLLIGGEGQDGPADTAVLSDVAARSVTSLPARLQHPRAWHTATLLPDGKVLIFGGIGGDGNVVDAPELFDPQAGSFIPSSSGLSPRAFHSATLLTDGRLLVAGGVSKEGEQLDRLEVWEFRTGASVTLSASLQTSRRKHEAALLGNGSVLLWGGTDGGGVNVAGGDLFDPEVGRVSWTGVPENQLETGNQLYLTQSLPEDNATDVPAAALISLRFSKPLLARTVNTETVILRRAEGVVETKVVPAENGVLAFVTPKENLQPGKTYTITLTGQTDANGAALPYTTITFITAGNTPENETGRESQAPTGQPPTSDEWIPNENNFKGDWRSGRPNSAAESQPLLQAAAGVTALSGQVLTLGGQPLAGVTLHVGESVARTDQFGRFILTKLDAGTRLLIIRGDTASAPGKTFGTFEVLVDVGANRTNFLPFKIWLPVLDEKHAVPLSIPTGRETVVTTPRVPGLEVRVPTGSVLRIPHGAHHMFHRGNNLLTSLAITPIPVDRPPMPLPPGAAQQGVLFTLQMHGAKVEGLNGEKRPGIRIIYPNYAGLPPGSRADFWNYDSTGIGWHLYGRGTVTQDGRLVMPDQGVELQSMHCLTYLAGSSSAPPRGPAPGNGAVAGDPVDLGTGLFVYSKTDLLLPGVMPIALTRVYRQNDSTVRPFGRGATTPYDLQLVQEESNHACINGDDNTCYQSALLILPDGGRIKYIRLSPGTSVDDAVMEHTATKTEFYKSTLTYNRSRNPSGWDLKLADGTVIEFGRFHYYTMIPTPATAIKDRFGNKITITRESGSGFAKKVSSSNNRWIVFTQNASGCITQAKDNTGRVVTYQYDGSNRLWKVTDPENGVTEYTYDTADRMLTIKDPRQIVYLTNEYDAVGRVKKQTLGNNGAYQFDYVTDAAGKIVQTDVTDQRGVVRRVTFNADGYTLTDTYAVGKPEQQGVSYERQPGTNFIVRETDSLGRKTTYTYDTAGNVTDVTRMAETSGSVTTHYTYDLRFNKITSVSLDYTGLNFTTALSYDNKGNLLSVTDPLNHQSSFTYYGSGQVKTLKNSLQKITELTYDSGDLVRVTDPLGRSVTREVDGAGRVIGIVGPSGRVTKFEYDGLNQVKKIIDPLRGMTEFEYDGNGNLLSVKDARGKLTSYTYNNLDQVETRTDSLRGPTSVERYEYDLAGNLKKVTDRRNKVTTFDYDSLGRLSFVGFGTTEGPTYESTINYTYDAYGRITQAADSASGTITRSYDDIARTVSETTPYGTVGYVYDKIGRLAERNVTGQSAVTHTYDVAGRLERINQGSAQVSFGYDAANRRTSLTLPNGIVVEYGYDDASRLTAITYKNGGTTLGNITYGYDFAGRRTKVGGSFARTSLPVGFNPASHDDANRLTQKEGSTLTYDESGNLTGDGVNTYSWDARNQLSGVSGGVTASFLYDAFGRRVGKTVNGLTTNYLYDGPNIVQELSGVSPLANILTGGTDEVFMRTDGQGTRSFLTDGLRSTLALADNSGNLLTQYTYDPFGGTTFSGAANDNTSQYTGRENDGTGLYYYRARYYSPSLHRFVSEDPIDFSAGDANLYAYVLNSPVNYTDPSGLSVWRTIFRVATQSAHPVANVRELTKRNAVAQVRAALDLAGEGAIIQAENDAARDAIARALSADGKLRRTDKYPENPYLDKSSGYPAGVHPNAGPYQHVHVQTAPPGRERLGMLFAPMSMTLSGRKDVTSAQFASAAAWDIISAVDPIFITDALEWYFGLSNE